MQHMQLATAVYEGGVLKLSGPVPGLADGDRVEVAVVRTAAAPPAPEDSSYEEQCQEFDSTRESSRKLFPPELRGVTW